MAQSGTGPAKIVRSQLLHSDPFRGILHDVPDCLLRHAFTQHPPRLGDPAEDLPSVDPRVIQPDAKLFHDPAGHRNRTNVSALAIQIDDGPVFLPLFRVFEPKCDRFVPVQTTGKQQRQERAIPFPFKVFAVGSLPECQTLLVAQPVAEWAIGK